MTKARSDTYVEPLLELVHLGLKDRDDLISCLLPIWNLDLMGSFGGDANHELI